MTICYRKKEQIDVSFSYVCPVIYTEFRHNIVKVVCGSTRLSPCGFTATLTMAKFMINNRTDAKKNDDNFSMLCIQLFQKTLSKEKQTSYKLRPQGSMGSLNSVFIDAVKVKFAITSMTSTSTVNIF